MVDHQITDELDTNIIAIVRQALADKISTGEAIKRIRHAQRVAAIERYGVKLVNTEPGTLDRMSRMLGLEL